MKILLAIDGSDCSKAAVDALVAQYQPQDTEVLVMNVVESVKLMPVSYGFGTGSIFPESYVAIAQQWRNEGEELVADVADRLQSAGFKTSTSVEEGDARERILDCQRSGDRM